MDNHMAYDAWWRSGPGLPCVTCKQGQSDHAQAVRALGPSFFPMHNFGPDRSDVPVHYLLVAMEPSSGWYERSVGEGKDPNTARNFGASNAKQDAPLQFAAREWLCDGNETFLLTDMAKCAVRDTKAAPAARTQGFRWENCASILEDEARLFEWRAVIAVGGSVRRALHDRPWVGSRLFSVLHFSQQAAGARARLLASEAEQHIEEPIVQRFCAFIQERRRETRKAQQRPDPDDTVKVGKGAKVLLAVYRKQFGCIRRALADHSYDCGQRDAGTCCHAVPSNSSDSVS